MEAWLLWQLIHLFVIIYILHIVPHTPQNINFGRVAVLDKRWHILDGSVSDSVDISFPVEG